MNNRRKLVVSLGAGALSLRALAQTERRPRRIGYFGAGRAETDAPWLAAFREGMAVLKWVEGRDYVLETRFGNSNPQALPALAAELIATQPEVIVAPGDGAVPPLLQVSRSIPIVFTLATDPVGLGFASSLQRPGGNVTGITSLGRELSAKRLQLLKEAFPKVTHVGLLHDSNQSGVSGQVKEFMDAASINGIRISPIDLKQSADFDAAFRQGTSFGVQAYALTHSVLTINNAKAIADKVFQSKLPAIFPYDMFVKAGGLMSYAPSLIDNFRRAAGYVDRILKGANPGDLPIQQPLTYELTVNLQTSKALGFKIPQSILVRADKVID